MIKKLFIGALVCASFISMQAINLERDEINSLSYQAQDLQRQLDDLQQKIYTLKQRVDVNTPYTSSKKESGTFSKVLDLISKYGAKEQPKRTEEGSTPNFLDILTDLAGLNKNQ